MTSAWEKTERPRARRTELPLLRLLIMQNVVHMSSKQWCHTWQPSSCSSLTEWHHIPLIATKHRLIFKIQIINHRLYHIYFSVLLSGFVSQPQPQSVHPSICSFPYMSWIESNASNWTCPNDWDVRQGLQPSTEMLSVVLSKIWFAHPTSRDQLVMRRWPPTEPQKSHTRRFTLAEAYSYYTERKRHKKKNDKEAERLGKREREIRGFKLKWLPAQNPVQWSI